MEIVFFGYEIVINLLVASGYNRYVYYEASKI